MMKRLWIVDSETGMCIEALADVGDDLIVTDTDRSPEELLDRARFYIEHRHNENSEPKGIKAGAAFAIELIKALRVELSAQGLSDAYTRGGLDQIEDRLRIYDEDDDPLAALRAKVQRMRDDLANATIEDFGAQELLDAMPLPHIKLMSREELLAEINDNDPDGLPERIIEALNDNLGSGSLDYVMNATGMDEGAVIDAATVLIEDGRIRWDDGCSEYEIVDPEGFEPEEGDEDDQN